jgi:uncharacterized protein
MRSRDGHLRVIESGVEFSEEGQYTYGVAEEDPLSAFARSERSHLIAREAWSTRVETRSSLSATAEEFLLTNELDAFEGDQRVFSKVWRSRVPRDFT